MRQRVTAGVHPARGRALATRAACPLGLARRAVMVLRCARVTRCPACKATHAATQSCLHMQTCMHGIGCSVVCICVTGAMLRSCVLVISCSSVRRAVC
jgi:hypothetical protein